MNFRLFSAVLRRADGSAWQRFLLGLLLRLVVPFNRSLRPRVRAVSARKVEIEVPYRKAALNHVGGMHACALATAAEITTGVLLLVHLDPAEFRILMTSMEIVYHVQARSAVRASANIDEESGLSAVVEEALSQGTAHCTLTSQVYDNENRLVCEGIFDWHIKRWNI